MSELMEELFGHYPVSPYITTINTLLLSIGYATILSLWMMVIYKSIHNQLSFNKKFAITLVMLSIMATVLLTLIQTNPLLSLGVFGSLHICRVRTNTKDPRDIGFVFWAIAIGICGATGCYSIGVIASLILGILLPVLTHFNNHKNKLLIVIRGSNDVLSHVIDTFNHYSCVIQSKNIFPDTFELVYELQLKPNQEQTILSKFSNMKGINGINVLSPETKVA